MIFAGQIVDGVGPYFDGADLLVLPGTGGLALNEAMAHGLPLVSGYGDGSADDLVQDGVNGFRLRARDARRSWRSGSGTWPTTRRCAPAWGRRRAS